MRSCTILFYLMTAAAILSAQTLTAETPNFAPGRYLLSNGMPAMGDNIFSDPCVADFNNDGRKDLLLGVYYYGHIYLFLNEGTDDDPIFGAGTILEADGFPIRVGFG